MSIIENFDSELERFLSCIGRFAIAILKILFCKRKNNNGEWNEKRKFFRNANMLTIDIYRCVFNIIRFSRA